MRILNKYISKYFGINPDNLPNLEKVLINTSWLFGDNVIRMAIGLIVSTLLARYLGPTQFGQLNYAIVFILMFSTISSLGLDNIVIRNIARNKNLSNETLGTTFILKSLAGTGIFLLMLSYFYFFQTPDIIKFTLITILSTGLIYQAFDVIDLYFQSQIQSKYIVIIRNISYIVCSILVLCLIATHAPLLVFAYTRLAEIVLIALGLTIVYCVRKFSIKQWSFSFKIAKELLKDSWPIILTGFATMIQAYSDQIMISKLKGDAELGQYSAALQIIAVLGFIPSIIVSSIAPIIASSKKLSHEIYTHQLLLVYRSMWFAFIIIAIPITLFANQIIFSLYGKEYQNAGILLSLMTIRIFFANMGTARNLFLINENLTKYSLLPTILGAIVNVSLNLFLIPRFASLGAIISMILSFSVTIFLVDLCFAPTRNNIKLIFLAISHPHKIRTT